MQKIYKKYQGVAIEDDLAYVSKECLVGLPAIVIMNISAELVGIGILK